MNLDSSNDLLLGSKYVLLEFTKLESTDVNIHRSSGSTNGILVNSKYYSKSSQSLNRLATSKRTLKGLKGHRNNNNTDTKLNLKNMAKSIENLTCTADLNDLCSIVDSDQRDPVDSDCVYLFELNQTDSILNNLVCDKLFTNKDMIKRLVGEFKQNYEPKFRMGSFVCKPDENRLQISSDHSTGFRNNLIKCVVCITN